MAELLEICRGQKSLAARLWKKRQAEEQEAPLCNVSEGEPACGAKAFARIWRSEKPDDVLALCLKHALREDTIFLVEPISRKDFCTFEYATLLERSVIARGLAELAEL